MSRHYNQDIEGKEPTSHEHQNTRLDFIAHNDDFG
jgi:hypothetical protein